MSARSTIASGAFLVAALLAARVGIAARIEGAASRVHEADQLAADPNPCPIGPPQQFCIDTTATGTCICAVPAIPTPTPTLTATPTGTVTQTPTVTATPTPTATPLFTDQFVIVLTDTVPLGVNFGIIASVWPNTARAITITQVCCEVDTITGAPSIQFQRDDDEGTNADMLASDLACVTAMDPLTLTGCTETFAAAGGDSTAQNKIAIGHELDLELVAGTWTDANDVRVAIKFTVD